MNRILLLAMLCIASASCVELENLCSSDAFEYNGVLVNAFHRLQQNVTFEPLSFYLINDTVKCDFFKFKNKTNFWEALRFKQTYNYKMVEWWFTEERMQKGEDYLLKKTQLIDQVGKLFNIINAEKDKFGRKNDECLEHFGGKVKAGVWLWNNLASVFLENGHLHTYVGNFFVDIKPNKDQLYGVLRKLFKQLKNSADGQTFVFDQEDDDQDSHRVYHYKRTVLPKEFKFLTEEGSDRVGPETKSFLTYDEFLPFNNENHKDDNCVPAKDLPLFYKSKGKNDIK